MKVEKLQVERDIYLYHVHVT